jgi:hypothetical protein
MSGSPVRYMDNTPRLPCRLAALAAALPLPAAACTPALLRSVYLHAAQRAACLPPPAGMPLAAAALPAAWLARRARAAARVCLPAAPVDEAWSDR